MSIDYVTKSTEVISILEREGYSAKTVAEHRRCFEELWKHLSPLDTPFAMEAALNWLESRKPAWSMDTYARYRRALYRFEKYLRYGEICCDPHCGSNHFAYHDTNVSYIKLPENYKALYREFHEFISGTLAKDTVNSYAAGCTDFLLFISEQDCIMPDTMTIEWPIKYLGRICEVTSTLETKAKYAEGVGHLLAFLSKQGHIPNCYSHVMSKRDEKAITSLKLNEAVCDQASFQPSKSLEACATTFLSILKERRYSVSSEKAYRYILINFFVFLEINHMAYSIEATGLWLNHIPRTTSWGTKRKIITWFANYVETESTERVSKFTWKPLLIDSLPKWSRKIIEDYLTLRQKEGLEQSSLMTIRSSCVRFFRFIDANGVGAANAITPLMVKEFHDTDPHATPEAGNAYGAKVRGLLKFMAEENLVPKNLYLAISTQCAPKFEIVTIMSDDMIDAVYSYRKNASSPNELRNAAMVMLGLRMGIRSSDIVNLKFCDFDWKNRKVTFIQKKTNKAITLSIPTDVGNSVYKYISQGRPQSDVSGVGFVFIRHNAPYTKLTRSICRCALACILSVNGLELPRGQGFHITRRTFATHLLKARTKVDSIADALGHASRMSVDDYMAHDEEGMLLCPLPFTIGGAL